MNITGIETLVFGVEDMAGCSQYLLDYGLERATDHPHHYVALDGAGVELFAADADHLPPAPNGCQMRKCVMGVADARRCRPLPVSWSATAKSGACPMAACKAWTTQMVAGPGHIGQQ